MVDELFTGQKLTLDDVKELCVKVGFQPELLGTKNGEDVYLTNGVSYAFLGSGISFNEIKSAILRFCEGDFGAFYSEVGAKPIDGLEYGCYSSSFGNEPYEGAIMVHRFYTVIVVYFDFEIFKLRDYMDEFAKK